MKELFQIKEERRIKETVDVGLGVVEWMNLMKFVEEEQVKGESDSVC